MRLLGCLFLGLSTLTMVGGCNTGADNNEVIKMENYSAVDELKKGLEGIKSSGKIGSNFGALTAAVRDLKKTDAAKSDLLDKELKELTALSDAAKIKAKATEILGKL